MHGIKKEAIVLLGAQDAVRARSKSTMMVGLIRRMRLKSKARLIKMIQGRLRESARTARLSQEERDAEDYKERCTAYSGCNPLTRRVIMTFKTPEECQEWIDKMEDEDFPSKVYRL